MGLKRGDVVLVSPPGKFGKPRPALVIQSDAASPTEFITYLPITSDLLRVPGVRVPVIPSARNGLRLPSEIMIDLIQTSSLARFRQTIGTVEPEIIGLVERALSIHLGLDG